jgi:hypothetical protein
MEAHVKDVDDRTVLVVATQPHHVEAIIELGGTTTASEADGWRIAYGNEDHLAEVLQRCRDVGLLFVGGPAGWPPAAVADLLREKGKMRGTIREIIWSRPDRTVVREI